MNKLLILTPDAEEYLPLIEAAGLPQLSLFCATETDGSADLIASCNIFLAEPRLASTVLEAASQLEWLQSTWAGVDSLCQTGMRRDYSLTGLRDIFGPLIAEYVMAYLFSLERRIFQMHSNQLVKRWQPLPYRQSGNITLGVVGLGSIGRQVARTAGGFGIRVIGLNRSGRPCSEVEKVFTAENLAEFLETPDYVVVTLPDTPNTRHFINADFLSMMKSSGVLINVGRGNVVNEIDLVKALEGGAIGAAVLDVFETEPLPGESPLWSMPNVFITPHVAAVSFPEDVIRIFSENYHRFLRDKSLLNLIDFERGY